MPGVSGRATWSGSWPRTCPSTRSCSRVSRWRAERSRRSTRPTPRDEVHHQLNDAGATIARDRPAVPRRRPGSGRGHPTYRDLRARRRPTASRRSLDLFGEPLAEPGRGRPARRRGGAALLVGHDRPVQGRDADHRNLVANVAPGASRRIGPGRRRRRRWRCCRSSTSTACRCCMNLRAARGRHRRDDAALRPRGVPPAASRSTGSPRLVRRAADRRSRWPSTRSSTSTTCRASQQVFSGAAPLGAELAEAVGKRLGCEVVQGYGMTELSPVSAT